MFFNKDYKLKKAINLYKEANRLFSVEKYSKSLKRYNKAIKILLGLLGKEEKILYDIKLNHFLLHELAHIYFNKSILLKKIQKLNECIESSQEAINHFTKYIKLYKMCSYFEMQQWERTASEEDMIKSQNKFFSDCYNLIGNSYYELDDDYLCLINLRKSYKYVQTRNTRNNIYILSKKCLS